MDIHPEGKNESEIINKLHPQLIHNNPLYQLTTQLRRLMIPAMVVLGGVMVVGGGVVEYNRTTHTTSMEKRSSLSEFHEASVAGAVRVKSVKVDIEGAVVQPGIREIPYNSRIADVLNAAGGLSPKADRTYVSKNINLAQVVIDGMKIYIPALGEATSIDTDKNNVAKSSNTTTTLSSILNINSASLEELDTLPGIGPVTAQKIVAARPYQSISDLQSRKVISASVFAKIKDLIRAP